MKIDRLAPEHVAEAMAGSPPSVNHAGCAVASLDASDALAAQGFPVILRAGVGDIEFVLHDTRSLLGHNLELHRDSDGFRGFFHEVLEASIDWDGSDPIRELNS